MNNKNWLYLCLKAKTCILAKNSLFPEHKLGYANEQCWSFGRNLRDHLVQWFSSQALKTFRPLDALGSLETNKVPPVNNRFKMLAESIHLFCFTNWFLQRLHLGRVLLLKLKAYILVHHFHFIGEESETQIAAKFTELISNCGWRRDSCS